MVCMYICAFEREWARVRCGAGTVFGEGPTERIERVVLEHDEDRTTGIATWQRQRSTLEQHHAVRILQIRDCA